MRDSVWPRYGTRWTARDLASLASFLLDKRTIGRIFKVALWAGVYVLFLFLPIPGVSPAAGSATPRWWFVSFLEQFLTAGAFSRGAVFCIGNVAVLMLTLPFLPTKGIFRILCRAGILAVLSICVTAALEIGGRLTPALWPAGIAFLYIFVGGWLIYHIDDRLVRANAPSTLHINVFLMLADHFRVWYFSQLSAADIAILVFTVLVVSGTAFYLFRHRTLLEVQHIKTQTSLRWSQLALPSLSEASLEAYSFLSGLGFLSIAGVISLLVRLRQPAPANFYSVVLVTVIASLFSTKLFGLFRILLMGGEPSALRIFTGPNPRAYARRMLDNFWIIPGVRAGRDTESFLAEKMHGTWRQALALMAIWIALATGAQGYTFFFGSGAVLFPYGPFLFLTVLAMVISNISMVAKNLSVQYRGFAQLARGRSRLIYETAQAYDLRSPAAAKSEIAGDSSHQYFDQQREMEELLDYIRIIRMHPIPREKIDGEPKISIVSHLVQRVLLGMLSAFVLGGIYVMVNPAGDVWQVVIPAFFAPLLAFEFLSRGRKRES